MHELDPTRPTPVCCRAFVVSSTNELLATHGATLLDVVRLACSPLVRCLHSPSRHHIYMHIQVKCGRSFSMSRPARLLIDPRSAMSWGVGCPADPSRPPHLVVRPRSVALVAPNVPANPPTHLLACSPKGCPLWYKRLANAVLTRPSTNSPV